MLPQKQFFRIGEVAGLVGVEPHVLRYWEREFRSIRPTKSAKGQRVYSRKDVENLLRVRDLLYRDGFTIAGARKKLARGESEEPSDGADEAARSTERVRFGTSTEARTTTTARTDATSATTIATGTDSLTTTTATRTDALASMTTTARPVALAATGHLTPASYAPAAPTAPDAVASLSTAPAPPAPAPLLRAAPPPLPPMSRGASAAREKLLALRGEVEAFLVELSAPPR